MYHFRTRDLVIALTYYREAEKYLDLLDKNANTDKAEFYFKMSEVYYYMKETHFSMNYAQRAYLKSKKMLREPYIWQGNGPMSVCYLWELAR